MLAFLWWFGVEWMCEKAYILHIIPSCFLKHNLFIPTNLQNDENLKLKQKMLPVAFIVATSSAGGVFCLVASTTIKKFKNICYGFAFLSLR